MAISPDFHFNNPVTPAQGAWCLAVSIISQADLSEPTTYTVDLDTVFDLSEGCPHLRFTIEIIRNAAKFNFIVYDSLPSGSLGKYFDDETGFEIIQLFSTISFNGFYPGNVKVTFHSSALPFLRKLQLAIHKLFRRNYLTPHSLMKHMRAGSPSIVLEMTALSNPYTLESFVCVRGVPKKWSWECELGS